LHFDTLLIKTIKLDGKYKTKSFFGVKLQKCHFRKKNQFKKYPPKRHRFEEEEEEEEKKKKKKKEKKMNGGARRPPLNHCSFFFGKLHP
jgi:hypothetical protein